MNYNALHNTINIFCQHKVSDVVLSPGSRSAPLTISFARNQGFRKYIIPDERSAGYIALGIALATGRPVIIVCTSGTAANNLSPAIAEAFYQKVPLIVLTADRPPEWIDQADGQAIHQSGIYGKNIKWYTDMPVDMEHPDSLWHAGRLVSEAVIESSTSPAGPVHLNFPFREPLYPGKIAQPEDQKSLKSINRTKTKSDLPEDDWEKLASIWDSSKRILLIAGQGRNNAKLNFKINKAALHFRIPVLCDIIANLNGKGFPFIYKHDLFIDLSNQKCLNDLHPDLVISFGESILSKNLKKQLRELKPAHHWHIGEAGKVNDTYQSLTFLIDIDPEHFFDKIISKFNKKFSIIFADLWAEKEKQTILTIKNFFPNYDFTELEAVQIILEGIDFDCNLHLANSLPVRLANYIGIMNPNIEVFSNRGTSGIDGCTSTAVGVSLSSSKLNILISGDMAFFYDRNALWHNHEISNLRIIILNNHGGGIFRMLDGPSGLPELEEYFETEQRLTAENTARDFHMKYFSANDRSSLKNVLREFFGLHGSPAILEIQTDSKTNTKIFSKLKEEIQKIWN